MDEADAILGVFGSLTPLVIAGLLATVNSELIDLIKRPITEKFPEHNTWYFVYINLVTGFLIGWFAQVNLLAGIVPEETVGRILSSLLIGGGSSLLYKIFKQR